MVSGQLDPARRHVEKASPKLPNWRFVGPGLWAIGLWWFGAGLCLGDVRASVSAVTPLVASPLFDDFDDAKQYPTVETLRGLLAPVAGEFREITENRKWEKPIRRISGLFRLNPPWQAALALRLSIFDAQHFQLHLWAGTVGVTLRYYPEYHQTWAAFGASREVGKCRPAEMALWATSEDYYRRSGAGTVELHLQAGRLFLTRGDLTLLSVPMAEPPSEVYFEGAALVRGLELVESKWTPEPPIVRPALLKTERPAELPWELAFVEGTRLTRTAEGHVELAADERAPAAEALMSLRQAGLYEITAEVEDAEPGTGFCLADAEGKPVGRVGFFRHRESGRKVFDVASARAGDLERSFDPNRLPVPYAGKRQWLRMVCGAGIFKVFTSGDGLHWRQPTLHSPTLEGACVKIGLYCLASPHKRSIRLRSLAVSRLDALYTGVSEALLAAVPPLPKRIDRLDEWDLWMAESRPPAVDPPVWRRACLLGTLFSGARPQIAQPLLTRLQESVLEETPGLSPERLVEFLRDSVLLYSAEHGASLEALTNVAQRFGGAWIARGHAAPFTAVSQALMRWPIWLSRRLPVFSDDLLRHELFLRVGQDREESVRAFCRRVRYWGRAGGPRQWDAPLSAHAEYLVQWADPVLVPRNAEVRRGRRAARPPTYQAANPLVDQFSKEGYNTISEIRAAVDAQAWREACQIILSVLRPHGLGLVPDGDDPRLLLSFPLAVAAELRDAPELAKTMADQFARVGRLRLAEAVSAGDEDMVLAVAREFPGTDLAAEAFRWLGDRQLASGRFSEAAGHYRRAVELYAHLPSLGGSASGGPSNALDQARARHRLAGAYLGQDWGQAAVESVQFGGTSLSAAEFERTVQELRESHRRGRTPPPSELLDLASLGHLVPGRYELRPWAKVEGQNLTRLPGAPERTIDWVARQTAAVAAWGRVLVHNRAELVAWDVQSGQKLWTQRIDSGEQGHRWPAVPMRPTPLGERILVRRLTSDGPELACIDSADGTVVWSSRPDDYVASDPVVVDGRPVALCASHDETGKASLAMVEFSGASGRPRRRAPIAEFRPLLRRPVDCQIVLADDCLIATAAGCVLAFTPTGRVLWIRRQVWVPPPGSEPQNSREWFEQYHDPLRVADGRVYATQPGVWGVECMELETGRLVWRQGGGNLRRLIGQAGNRLILETSDGPVALHPATGAILWTRLVPRTLAVRICSQPASVVCVSERVGRVSRRERPDGISLSWHDAATGQPLGTSAVDSPLPSGWLVGPFFGSEKRQWMGLASRQQPAQRELFEMIRVGDADPP